MLNKTVLIVERDADEAKKIVGFFRKNGFRNKIEVVHSKSEAMDYVFHSGKYAGQSNHETPGLILLDLLTDRTQEVKLLKPLHWYLRTAEVPIIVLTSSEEQEREVIAHELGIVGFVRKPLDFTHFIEVIQQMGMKWKNQGR